MTRSLSATGGISMDAPRYSAMNTPQLPTHQQRWQGPKDFMADPQPCWSRRRGDWGRGMRLLSLIGLLGLLSWGAAPPPGPDLLPQAPDVSRHAPPMRVYGQLPLSFEANQGQTDGQVQFLAHGQGYTLFLTAREAVFAFRPPAAPVQRPMEIAPRAGAGQDPPDRARAVVGMQLPGANPAPPVVRLEELPGTVHYFRGNDPQQWRTHVPTYAKVQYTAVYPGVDLVYYGHPRHLEYDFLVAPGADPTAITLGFAG